MTTKRLQEEEAVLPEKHCVVLEFDQRIWEGNPLAEFRQREQSPLNVDTFTRSKPKREFRQEADSSASVCFPCTVFPCAVNIPHCCCHLTFLLVPQELSKIKVGKSSGRRPHLCAFMIWMVVLLHPETLSIHLSFAKGAKQRIAFLHGKKHVFGGLWGISDVGKAQVHLAGEEVGRLAGIGHASKLLKSQGSPTVVLLQQLLKVEL